MVPENATDDEIRLAIMNDLYSVTYSRRDKEKTLYIPREIVSKYNAFMRPEGGILDYKQNDIPRYQTIESWTVNFENGYEVDIKVCSSNNGDPLWCEAVLFLHGCEITCTEVADELTGNYEFENDGKRFTVHVKEEQ